MKVIGPINSVTPLTLTNFRYNGNNVCSNAMNGMLTVVSGAVTGRVSFENEPFPIPTVSPTPTPRPVPNTKLNAAGGTSFFSLATRAATIRCRVRAGCVHRYAIQSG